MENSGQPLSNANPANETLIRAANAASGVARKLSGLTFLKGNQNDKTRIYCCCQELSKARKVSFLDLLVYSLTAPTCVVVFRATHFKRF